MSHIYVLDANVVIRFFLKDHKQHSAAAKRFFERAAQGEYQILLTHLCVAEVVWVLTGYYECERPLVARQLLDFLYMPGINVENSELIEKALDRYRQTNVDFLDCYIASVSRELDGSVASFDKDFKKFNDIDWQSLGSI